jgi:sporulation integral membrane protein YlbJ
MDGNRTNKKIIYITAGALSCIGCIAMMACPSVALSAAKKGITLWASSVFPALLPFFICANFMTALGIPQVIGKALERPFRRMFDVPGVASFVFTVSITSGYPMGAKLIGDLGRSGEITRNEARRMVAFCSTSGPLFMLGAVGAGMLASPAAGTVIALSHYVGAILNGFLYRTMVPKDMRLADKKWVDPKNIKKSHGTGTENMLDLLTEAMLSAFRSLFLICGYIVLFMLLTDLIQYSGALNRIDSESVRGLIKGLFEMTVGCSSIAGSDELKLLYQCIICSFLISFGGLSVCAQSMSMLSGLRIGTSFYLTAKLAHGLFAASVAAVIGPLLLHSESLMAWAFQREEIISRLGFIYQLLFSTKMVIMVVVLFFATILFNKAARSLYERFRNHRGV